MRGHRVRLAAGGLAAVALIAFSGIWALPNVFGSTFVHVRAVVTPVESVPAATSPSAGSSAVGPSVTLASGRTVRADRLEIAADVENAYPLSVVLGSDPIAYTAAVFARTAGDGSLVRVWESGAGDPTIEEGSDSPVGGGSAKGAVVVPPGTMRHAVAEGDAAFVLVRPQGSSVAPGIYYVRVWAYGIASPLVPVSID